MKVTGVLLWPVGDYWNRKKDATEFTEKARIEVEIDPSKPYNEAIEIAERFFAEWSYGSGKEVPEFMAQDCRSMSVGDVVFFPELETALMCDSIGWSVTPTPKIREAK